MSGFNDGFGGAFDHETIQERNNVPAVVKRKQRRSSEKLREAQQAYENQQMLHDYGITQEEIDDE